MERQGDVFILYFGDEGKENTENRFHPDWMVAVHAHLDEVLAHEGPVGLVTTALGKFYSTGADLAWGAENAEKIDWYLTEILALVARMLSFPVHTVAALQGHAFGAGAILATAHDHRMMRADRGFFCFPGINLGSSYPPGVFALAASRLPPGTAHEALTTGHRYPAAAALAAGLVDNIASEDELLSQAVERAQSLAHTRGPILGEIKKGLHHRALALLRTPITGFETPEGPRKL